MGKILKPLIGAMLSLVLLLALQGCQSPSEIVYSSSPARVVSVPERYSAEPGVYIPGRYGDASWLWVSSGSYLEYPVLFNQKNVTEGTVSIWYKPSRPRQQRKSNYKWLKIGDGLNELSFGGRSEMIDQKKGVKGARWFVARYSSKANPKNTRSLGKVKLTKDAQEGFHHLLFTWDQKGGELYFDGRLIAKKDFVLPAFNGEQTRVRLLGGRLDDFLVLNKKIAAKAVADLHNSTSSCLVNENTALYVPFDRQLTGQAYVRADGDLVRMFSRIGRPDATFRLDDPVEIDFYMVNYTDKTKKLYLSGSVADLKKAQVLNKKINMTLEPGQVAQIPFLMGEIKEKGLFWGDFELLDAENLAIAKERIPFAVTIAPDVKKYSSKEISTGLVRSKGINPPCYEKWARFESELWDLQEYAPGKWNFEPMDMMVESAISTGREPTLMLYGTPMFYFKLDDLSKPTRKCAISTPPKNIEDFKNYVRKIGERYKGKVKYYEIWNEPYWNDMSGGYFYGSAERYAEMVNAAAKILHEIDSDNQVMCGMGGAASWQKLVAKKTAGSVDIFGVHPYDAKNYPFPKVKRLLKKHGASTRVACTEIGNCQLQRAAIDQDGYPMTAAEFDKSGRWEKIPASSYLKSRGRKDCADAFTSGAYVVKSLILSLAGGCEHFLWWSSGTYTSVANLTSLPQTPSIPSVAYANAAGFLAAHRFVKRIDLGADYLKAYLFKSSRDDSYLIVAWSDTSPDTVNLEIADSRLKVSDIFANAYPFKHFGPVIQTKLTKSPIYLSGLSSIPQKIRPILKAVQCPDVGYPGSVGEIVISTYNPLARSLTGELVLKFPDTFRPVSKQTVDLKPKEERDYSFKFVVPATTIIKRNLLIEFDSNDPGIKVVRIKHRLNIKKSASAEKSLRPAMIDGDLKEWGSVDSFPLVIDQDSQVAIGTPYTKVTHDAGLNCDWRGPKDLSLKAKFRYDDKNLYLAIRVFDDRVMNDIARDRPPAAYRGDCVELFLDARAEAKQGINDVDQNILQLLISPSLADFPAPTSFVMIPKGKKLIGLTLASKLLEDGYTMEVRIPWSNFPKLNPKSLKSIGLDLAVDDKDDRKSRSRKSQIMWSGGADNHGNPSGFGVLKFK